MAADTRLLAAALAAGRIAIGAGLWLSPQRAAKTLGFDRLDTRALMLGRIAGTRDIVIGTWQLGALDDPPALRRASAAAAIADAGDALTFALGLAGGERQAGLRGVAAALPASIAGAWLATH